MSIINNRLFSLRGQMAMMGIDAVIIPHSDPHMSEYIADHFKFREWISGFSGSAGTVVVTQEKAGLWTDSRYFIQAKNELNGSEIELFKMGMPDVPSYQDWLISVLPAGSVVGIDGKTFSADEAGKLSKLLRKNDIRIDTKAALQDIVWEGRPAIPESDIFELDIKYAGKSRKDKIEKVRSEMKNKDATHYIVCALDEIAWFLNLRGNDVEYNPVFYSYLIISQNNINLFIDPHKITASTGKNLAADNVKVFLYDDFYDFLNNLPSLSRVLIDPVKVNYTVVSTLPSGADLIRDNSIITRLKGIKNNVEIEGMKKCHIRDGVAMVKFLYWLDSNIGKTEITEISAADKLKSFREEQENYIGESFGTISAYGPNAALPHYSASEKSNATMKPEGFYLVDSGGQYLDGTTDITRTVALGPLTSEQKKDFTLVLKGHINLSQAVFPQGTRGVHLDILARSAMWKYGINYGHGTGHGVGHFLNVHEGPQSIRPQDNGTEIEEGMITSNEPGIYKESRYGIRTENLILTTKAKKTEFGTFYAFETITLCPVDTRALDIKLLTDEEKKWINNYHSVVYNTLKEHLDEQEQNWLYERTKPV
ncbi:MAG: aminopeptidase P family protein [Chlorobi bacterium]|nr:aminopeptidase P family protein [Chlorobiota bacterium]